MFPGVYKLTLIESVGILIPIALNLSLLLWSPPGAEVAGRGTGTVLGTREQQTGSLLLVSSFSPWYFHLLRNLIFRHCFTFFPSTISFSSQYKKSPEEWLYYPQFTNKGIECKGDWYQSKIPGKEVYLGLSHFTACAFFTMSADSCIDIVWFSYFFPYCLLLRNIINRTHKS